MKKTLFLNFLIIIALGSICLRLQAQEMEISWDYPIKPGSKEWDEREDRGNFMAGLRIMNIPSDTLKSINTDHLVKVCLHYPFWPQVFSRNSLQEGYDFLKNNFNGFRELENRPNAAEFILQEYKKMDPADFKPGSTLAQKGEYMARFTFIELLLAQHEIINNVNEDIKRKIIEESLKKFQEKIMIRSYGIEGLVTTAYIMARFVNNLNGSQNLFNDISGHKDFLNNCKEINFKPMIDIANKTENFIRNKEYFVY
jgi:hypothetical protein